MIQYSAAIAELEKDMLNLKKNIQMSKQEEEKAREQKRLALRSSLKPDMEMVPNPELQKKRS